MEGLAPPLACIIELQVAIRNGEPIRMGLQHYLARAPSTDDFALQIRRFILAWERGQSHQDVLQQIRSPHRRTLIDTLTFGLNGQTILPALEELKTEIEQACDIEIKHHLEMLPIKMLIPLLFFQFPAFLLLLFGPLLRHLIEEMNR